MSELDEKALSDKELEQVSGGSSASGKAEAPHDREHCANYVARTYYQTWGSYVACGNGRATTDPNEISAVLPCSNCLNFTYKSVVF
ncbi:MAG: bacteriocin [Coriobacteriales bacterium]|jgi:bacteriocin-like protein|nr:bacteriocin [Coriobacteriales bacterium]